MFSGRAAVRIDESRSAQRKEKPYSMIELQPLACADREQFIKDNQEAFNYGALVEFGRRDDHFEEEGQIISRETIEASIDGGEAYRIVQDGRPVGGVVINVDGERGGENSICCSFRQKSIARALATRRGARSSGCIRR